MAEHVIIDGNNLLHAMRAHAPVPHVGRETMVRIIEAWARRHERKVTLVFDGAEPRGGLAKQMASSRVAVRFSAPRIADDLVIDVIHGESNPQSLRVVTADTAILHEAGYRRCLRTSPPEFIAELFADDESKTPRRDAPAEKPEQVSRDEAARMLELLCEDDARLGDEELLDL